MGDGHTENSLNAKTRRQKSRQFSPRLRVVSPFSRRENSKKYCIYSYTICHDVIYLVLIIITNKLYFSKVFFNENLIDIIVLY